VRRYRRYWQFHRRNVEDVSIAEAPLQSAAHRLSPVQIAAYDVDGYLVLPGLVPPDLLERLRSAGERWMQRGHDAGGTPEEVDYQFADRPSGRVMFRVDYLHGKGEPASLELLGLPEMLGIAESLGGPNAVPTYESMVFKADGDGAPIHWHQDAVHPRRYRIFNVDVYLDDSLAGVGALRVVPGSQHQRTDICVLEESHGWDVPGAVEVPLHAGDVLIHDVMIVHGSPPVVGNKLRRTIYYEFRPAEQIAAEGPWDESWVRRRMSLIPLALDEHARSRPHAEQFPWSPAPQFAPSRSQGREADLRIVHEGHTPGSFCSAGSVGEPDAGAPVPRATR